MRFRAEEPKPRLYTRGVQHEKRPELERCAPEFSQGVGPNRVFQLRNKQLDGSDWKQALGLAPALYIPEAPRGSGY